MLRRPTRPNGSLPTHGSPPNDTNTVEYGGGYGSPNVGSPYGGYAGGGGMDAGGSATYGGYAGGGGGGSNNSNDFKEKSRKSHRGGSNPILHYAISKLQEPWIWSIIISIIFFILTLHYRSKYNSILSMMDMKNGNIKDIQGSWERNRRLVEDKNRQVTMLQEQQRKNIQKQNLCENDKRTLEKEKQELRIKYENNPSIINEKNRLLSRDNAWKDQVEILQKATQRESRRSVIDK